MGNVNKGLRHVRFKVKPSDDLKLVIETSLNEVYEFGILECSLTGLSARYRGDISQVTGLAEGSVVPVGKLQTGTTETSLGRLVVRRSESKEGDSLVAFSTIDFKIPVDGVLSPFLADPVSARKSPYEFELSPDRFNVGSFEDHDRSNVDLLHRTRQFKIYFDEWIQSPKYQHHNIRMPSQGERVHLRKARRGGRNDYLVMGSNDYLGLASHPEVKAAAKKAVDDYGFGSTGSPLTTGIADVHDQLCDLLAKTLKKEKVLLFNSGYAANIGGIAGLTRDQDLIVGDFLCHASLQDAMQMSRATTRLFKHNDLKHLRKLLRDMRPEHSGALIITEGVFSMDGDTPPITEIMQLANEYNARVFLDEAHSFGVTGPNGLGCWETSTAGVPDVLMGTFSKVLGGIGGFLAADESVIDWLTWHARSHVFSVSMPPSTAAAALAALRIFLKTPELTNNLQRNIRHFVSGLRELGCPIDSEHPSAVIPLIVGDEKKLGTMNQVLQDHGVYVIPVIYPAVSRKNSRFRFTVMATHTISDLDFVLSIVEKAMAKAQFKFEFLNQGHSSGTAA